MSKWSEVTLLPVKKLRELLKAREISPVELAKACLAQIEEWNSEVNAVVTLSTDLLNDAREAESAIMRQEDLGILHGIPVGIKEVTPVRGMRTTYGSLVYTDYVPTQDALVVSRFRRAGAIILGKTNASEFAAGANTYNEVFGSTRNPWNSELTSGGSTGGGAAGLATGMFGIAEGTDLGGSLRIPAAFCGVVGLRPSPGLIPTSPSDYLWDTLQVTGPMVRDVDDLPFVLEALAGPSPDCPISGCVPQKDFVDECAGDISFRKISLAYCPDISGIGVDSDIENSCRKCVAMLEDSGARVTETNLDLSGGRDAFAALRGHWMLAHHLGRLEHLENFGPNLAGNIRFGLGQDSKALGEAERTRSRIRKTFIKILQKNQFLLTPTVAVPPFLVEKNYPESINGNEMETYIDWIAPTFLTSLPGLPVLSVPCGVDSRGLPVGIQITGCPHDEVGVIKLAKFIQGAFPVVFPKKS